ncbi:sulfate ABC transporter substrate-binding protein [Sinorhizobium medicae]|uniref:Sulfate ABC transporter substrate-binding protein n=1 Tax=Sinorhizobium medicae TaxID=110321 RepID=A0A6G1WRU2_9HYPH|nr:sulfate ABC transporter substrate-binding protein [Sinorhizobium medicae]MBO1941628.1 sulfate ABC transporter substrate-binding protein [Sinorhizobium medicae]MDX0403840.1 sulfate ABC transporter substrate-binding protein [Sinorhizobium medicae]MDX0413781.1 sulfate ABC transporter substrate-binding protein [Sinorhizobium medicae]MDX0415271.1 sulfate ABC transporter substrate-binding protein [Sinorhizobium medicae]MDX0421253.1 sulfate ABC transporter substrate-binding protein [Sinorhizobium 
MSSNRLAGIAKLALVVGSLQLGLVGLAHADTTILNVSYDPTRELYKEFNAAFAEKWRADTGETVTIQTSHGGSGKQARSVIDGLEADVVTLALEADIDAIARESGKIPADWKTRLDNNSSPYTSTIVFLVRKGNPKGIKDWGDLVREDVQVITPNPKTSGGARWNFLAAWAWARAANNGDDTKAQEYVTQLFKHVPVLDTGARGATTTFVQRGLGDVLLAWENEAYLSLEELGPDNFDIVTPSISIKAEPPVALVDGNVERKGTRKVAEAYLDYLYSDAGQKIAAKHYYRPFKPEAADPEDTARFKELKLVTINDFGGWKEAQPKFFGDGGIFDQIYRPGQ